MNHDYEGPERRRPAGGGHPMPIAWLEYQFESMRDDVKDRHDRLRADMQANFTALGMKFDHHVEDDNLLENRVLVMETERKGEKAEASKKGAIMGIIAATGLTVVWELIKKATGWGNP
jgi:hypothetical protein